MLNKIKGHYICYVFSYQFFYFSVALFASIMTLYLTGIGKDAGQVAFIISAGGVMTLGFQPVIGYLADKTQSPKKVAMLSMVAALITGSVYVYLRNDMLLFIGYGTTVAIVMSASLLMERIALKSRHDYGKIRIWGSIGWATGSQAAAIIYGSMPAAALFIIFEICVAITILGYFTLDDVKVEENTEAQNKVEARLVIKSLAKNKPYLMFLLLCFIFQGISGTGTTYFPLLITDSGGTVAMVGTAILLATLFEVPIILLSKQIFSKIKLKAIAVLSFLVMALRYGWYATLPSPSAVVYVFFFQGFSIILFIMMTNYVLIRIVEEEYFSTALSLSAVVGRGIGVMVFQNILGQLTNNRSIGFLYASLAILALVGMVIAIFAPLEKQASR